MHRLRDVRAPRVASLLTVALLLSACAGSGFQYVKNDDFNAYFKLDEDWAVYDEGAYISADPRYTYRPLERLRLLNRTWVRGFDGSAQPKVSNLFVNATPDPHGFAKIQVMTGAEQEQMSVIGLRAAHLGFDPVLAKRAQPHGPIEVLSEETVSLEGGEHGVRLRVAFDTPSGQIAVYDQTALVDASNRILYLFVIGCSQQCYSDHQEAISEIAESWTIEEA